MPDMPDTAYLDHAATTPVRDDVIDVVARALHSTGNPSALHGPGRTARARVEEARESVAESLGASPNEVVFTSGGTEADNLAVQGIYRARRSADPRRHRVLTAGIEHHAVLDTVAHLARVEAATTALCPVDQHGRIDLAALESAIASDPGTVALVAVMWANNEVGTLQPVPEIAALGAEHGIPVHSDAVQAISSVDVDFAASGLAALAVTGHKIGAPVGTGALLVRTDVDVHPVSHGGGQERDIRSGTLDAAGAAGFAAALRSTVAERDEHVRRLTELRELLVGGVLSAVPDAQVNGSPDPEQRLPGVTNIAFPGCEADSLMLLLDSAGVACSTGSACSAGVPEASHVLAAMGFSNEQARGALRFSLGHTSTRTDVERLTSVIGDVVERARAARLATSARGG